MLCDYCVTIDQSGYMGIYVMFLFLVLRYQEWNSAENNIVVFLEAK